MCHRKCANFGLTNGMKIDDNIMCDSVNNHRLVLYNLCDAACVFGESVFKKYQDEREQWSDRFLKWKNSQTDTTKGTGLTTKS